MTQLAERLKKEILERAKAVPLSKADITLIEKNMRENFLKARYCSYVQAFNNDGPISSSWADDKETGVTYVRFFIPVRKMPSFLFWLSDNGFACSEEGTIIEEYENSLYEKYITFEDSDTFWHDIDAILEDKLFSDMEESIWQTSA